VRRVTQPAHAFLCRQQGLNLPPWIADGGGYRVQPVEQEAAG